MITCLAVAGLLFGCASTFPYRPGYTRLTGRTTNSGSPVSVGYEEEGVISYYSKELKGRRTASGEKFDPSDYTAAHRTLPFQTKIRVTLIETGKSVEVRVNDRGPFKHSRILDVSHAAAKELGLIANGSGHAKIEVIE